MDSVDNAALRKTPEDDQKTIHQLHQFQTDVLILIVGANPLPNFVAAQLLTRFGAQVYLLHTGGERSTMGIADRLQEQVAKVRSDLHLHKVEIDKVDGNQIAAQTTALVKKIPENRTFGLHYTGGTKPMAVHSYDAAHKLRPDGIYSYLDPELLSLVIAKPGTPMQRIFVGQTINVDLETLYALHNYTVEKTGTPGVPQPLVDALIQISREKKPFEQWHQWLRTLGDRSTVPALPSIDEYPYLAPVIEAFDMMCGGAANPPAVAHILGETGGDLKRCSIIVSGEWLEAHTWQSLESANQTLNLADLAANVTLRKSTRPRTVELDVLAMSGYQLHAISCMATQSTNQAKQHLTEAYVRARQLGGDEARFGLVCLVQTPQALQMEVEEALGEPNKVRVFGWPHLQDLAAHLEAWIRETSYK